MTSQRETDVKAMLWVLGLTWLLLTWAMLVVLYQDGLRSTAGIIVCWLISGLVIWMIADYEQGGGE